MLAYYQYLFLLLLLIVLLTYETYSINDVKYD